MEKRCTGCGETKQVKEFHKRKRSQDGFDHKCKACAKAYQQTEKGKAVAKAAGIKYKKTDEGKENKKRADKKYRQTEKGREAQRRDHKKYAQTAKGREAQRKYSQSEKAKQASDRYIQSVKGKEKLKKYRESREGKRNKKRNDAIRKTRKTEAGGSYTTDQWFNLCKFYDFRCLKCNKKFPFEKLTLDHVKPVSKGGSSDIWNTQPLCKRCNTSKHNKEIDYRKTLPPWLNRDGPTWIQDELF